MKAFTPRAKSSKYFSIALAQRRRQPLGIRANPQHPLGPVMIHKFRPQKLRRLARRHPPRHIHLPQPVLRRHIALRLEKIIEIRRFNVWNPMPVASDRNRNLQSRQLQLPIKLRKRHMHRVLQPPRAAQCRRPSKHHQDHDYRQ